MLTVLIIDTNKTKQLSYCRIGHKKMKKCEACGAPLQEGDKFCRYCGTAVPLEITEQEIKQEAEKILADEAQEERNQKAASAGATFSLVVGIIDIVLGFLGFFVLGLLNPITLTLSILGIIYGAKASKTSGVGKAGLILNIVAIIISFIGVVIWSVGLASGFIK